MQSEAVPFKHPWKETNLGSVSVVEVGGTPSTAIPAFWSGGDIPWMSSGDVHQRRIVDVPGRITKLGFQSSNAKLIEPPAVAMALAGQGKTRGTVALTLLQVCTNQSVALVKGQDGVLDTSFLFHALDARYEELRARSAGGGRAGLSKAIIEAIPIPLPSLEEQQHITEILDTVDETIALTTSLIAKLKQIRAGLLHDLLTRGLDEDGKLRDAIAHREQFKDSLLAKIPDEWVVCTLEECVRHDAPITYGIVQAGPHVEGGIPYIRTGDMAGDRLNIERLLRTSPPIAASYRRSKVRAGEIVCAIRATVGKVLEIPPELDGANLTQGTARIAPREDINKHFLLGSLQSNAVKRQFELVVKGTTFAEITLKDLRKIIVPIPLRTDEQEQIANILDAHNNRIYSEEAYLNKLKFQKKGLMHDLLTGRVRVNTLQQVSA